MGGNNYRKMSYVDDIQKVGHLTINEIRNPSDVAHARIYSRVLEMCTPVHVSGSDRRKSIGMDKQRTVKEVLDL